MNGASVVARADADSRIGTGHVMRMWALAQGCRRQGVSVAIACARCPAAIRERIQSDGIAAHSLPDLEQGSSDDLRETGNLARTLGATWVVLDGYAFGTAFQRGIRERVAKVMTLDDFGHCDHWCADAILNQNIGAEIRTYESDIDPCLRLLGVKYALLRDEFLAASAAPAPRGERNRIVVTMGGADPDNITARILEAFDLIHSSTIELDVILGAANPHGTAVEELARQSRHETRILRDVKNIAGIYQNAQAVVSAAGSTCWEWLHFGLGGAVVVLAENQAGNALELERAGLAVNLGLGCELDTEEGARGLDAVARGDEPEGRGTALVDGRGADRVAAVLKKGMS